LKMNFLKREKNKWKRKIKDSKKEEVIEEN
jgi:hypothetical protein